MSEIEVQACISHDPDQPHLCPPCTKQDFKLSDDVSVKVNKGQEVTQDIILHPNLLKDFGTVSGCVKDPCGHPVAYALVKVFDHKHRPFAHVFTNHEGQFLICLPPGHYFLKAVR
ncbi:MAG: carboxypeptidase-like regulatory domain-containing protein, partial [Peptococcaceae bacterium]|nr:carboxypeptidase-like regulatory domain-containing protein [Peptococcaceae bacterium]